MLTTAEVANLSTAQIAALTATQAAALTTADVVALTTGQIVALSTAAVAALTATQIASMETADVAALTTAQMAAIVCSGMRAFTQAQVAALSTAQLNALSFSTPLVLDLTDRGIQTTHIAAGIRFDLNATGEKLSVGWISAQNGFLVADLDNDGVINNGSELFGNGTRLPTGERSVNGFAALQALDTSHDGVINSEDSKFSDLKVWIDANQDGKTQTGELHSLGSLAIVELDLDAKNVSIENSGNLIGMVSKYVTADGKSHTLADVWLQTSNSQQNRVTDLSSLDIASVTPGSLAKIDLSGGPGDRLVLNANAISQLGQAGLVANAISGTMQMLVLGDANDIIELTDPQGQWSDAGTTMVNDVEYHIYNHDFVQLLVGVNMRLEFDFG